MFNSAIFGYLWCRPEMGMGFDLINILATIEMSPGYPGLPTFDVGLQNGFPVIAPSIPGPWWQTMSQNHTTSRPPWHYCFEVNMDHTYLLSKDLSSGYFNLDIPQVPSYK
jgi:hypothetical protein